MSFFKNINATPRIGSVIRKPNGFSIYTDNGWQEYTADDISYILDNARIVEKADGSCVDIDDIFGEHISDEHVFYELILRCACNLPFSQIAYFGDNNRIWTRILTISAERLIFDHQELYIRGWFSSHEIIKDIFEKYPNNIEHYARRVIKYLQNLKSEGLSYKYIDKRYMYDEYDILEKKYHNCLVI